MGFRIQGEIKIVSKLLHPLLDLQSAGYKPALFISGASKNSPNMDLHALVFIR